MRLDSENPKNILLHPLSGQKVMVIFRNPIEQKRKISSFFANINIHNAQTEVVNL